VPAPEAEAVGAAPEELALAELVSVLGAAAALESVEEG
jgi:hypothetical protein